MNFREAMDALIELTGQEPKRFGFLVDCPIGLEFSTSIQVCILLTDDADLYYYKILVRVPTVPLLSVEDSIRFTAAMAQALWVASEAQTLVGGQQWTGNEIAHYEREHESL